MHRKEINIVADIHDQFKAICALKRINANKQINELIKGFVEENKISLKRKK